jgi:hypothetical protein
MAHTCNPSYLGGKDQEDPPGKKSSQDLIPTNQSWVRLCAHHLGYPGSINRRTAVQASPGKTPSQNNQIKKGQGCGSSGGVPAKQAGGPAFNP